MKVLRKGAKGPGVKAWQIFLRGQGYHIIADADFGKKTVSATKAFQKKKRLVADGVVGNATYAVAMLLGRS